MTDTALRLLSRRTDVSPQDQAKLLVAELRAGLVNPSLVQLHAELGDEIASQVCTPTGNQPDEGLVRDLCSNPEHGLAYDDPRWGRMCYVPAGISVVGAKDDDAQAYVDEKPQHLVFVPAFWMQQYPATVAQAGIGEPVSGGTAAVNVSWNDCHEKLAKSEPPVAEHRAIRGGSWWDTSVNCRAARRSWAEPGYRLVDLGFRVASSPQDQDSAKTRVFRGGSWGLSSARCRASHRGWFNPVFRYDGLGFRVVLSPPQDSSLPSAVLPSYRLPLEDEFERAARGWDGRIYPWGNDWIADRAERLSKPSPWGIHGLCGEAWCWTQDKYVADRRPLIQPPEVQT